MTIVASEAASGKQASYLEWLSENDLANVLRYLSSDPLSPQWRKGISSEHALIFLRCGGPLGAFTENISTFGYSPLRVSRLPRLEYLVEISGFSVSRDSPKPDIVGELRSILRLLNENVPTRTHQRYIHLKLRYFWKDINLDLLLADIAPNLNHLDMKDDYLYDKDIRAIARHCVGLPALTLSFKYFADLHDILSSIAPSLRFLSVTEQVLINAGGESVGLFDALENAHSALSTKLALEVQSLCDCRSVPAMTQFGPCLRSIRGDAGRSPPVNIREHILSTGLLDACPDVLVDGFVPDLDTLRALGKRARKVEISSDIPVFALAGVGEQCVNLEDLTMSSAAGEWWTCATALALLLSDSLPKLAKITLNDSFRPSFSESAEQVTLSAMHAMHCPEVEEISFRVAAEELHGRTPFGEFVKACPKLRKITARVDVKYARRAEHSLHLGTFSLREAAYEMGIKLMKQFAQCAALEDVTLTIDGAYPRSIRMDEACGPLRARGGQVIVNRVSYSV